MDFWAAGMDGEGGPYVIARYFGALPRFGGYPDNPLAFTPIKITNKFNREGPFVICQCNNGRTGVEVPGVRTADRIIYLRGPKAHAKFQIQYG